MTALTEYGSSTRSLSRDWRTFESKPSIPGTYHLGSVPCVSRLALVKTGAVHHDLDAIKLIELAKAA